MTQPRAQRHAVTSAPLPWRPGELTGSAKFADFCRKFVKVPRGSGALRPLILRDWQLDLVAPAMDDDGVRTLVLCLPRGSGKTSLMAAWAIFEMLCGQIGAHVVIVAVDERQAGILGNTAKRMCELDDRLTDRVILYAERIACPSRGASIQWLPASEAGLQGLAPSLALIDEVGYVDQTVWETVLLGAGKVPGSLTVGIGTPGPRPDNVLAQMRQFAIDNPDDGSLAYVEHSAAGFEQHPPDCAHCWELAMPSLDDFLDRDAVRATLPPRTSEGAFRRARLCQAVSTVESPLVDEATWNALCRPEPIPDGTEVVLGLDGSWGGTDADSTAIVVATIGAEPHVDLYRIWENDSTPTWRVPILEVEDAIREACKRWNVKEIAADPFRLGRTLAVLAGEGHRVTEFPFSPPRVTRATTDLHSALVGGKLTHTGNPTLTKHVLSTQVHEDGKGGLKIGKVNRRRGAAKIDACSALLIAHSRSTWHASKTKPKRRTLAFR
jgi:phage terminase large subunit-like protein